MGLGIHPIVTEKTQNFLFSLKVLQSILSGGRVGRCVAGKVRLYSHSSDQTTGPSVAINTLIYMHTNKHINIYYILLVSAIDPFLSHGSLKEYKIVKKVVQGFLKLLILPNDYSLSSGVLEIRLCL